MSIRSIIALRRAGKRARRGADGATILPILDAPLSAGDGDPRLAIQKGILSGDRAAFNHAMERAPKNGAAPLLAAYYAWIEGDRSEAERLTGIALKLAPKNITAQAMRLILDLANGKATASTLTDPHRMALLPVVTGPVQGELLRLVEERILTLAPDDCGAADREELLQGPAGWLLDRFDDLALLIGWGAGHALNTLLHIANATKRRAYRHVIAGDLAAGLHHREKAKMSFLTAQEIDPSNAESAESLISFALEEGDVADATQRINAYTKLLAEEADDTMAHSIYGPTLRRWRADLAWLQGDLTEAVSLYEEVAKEDPFGWFPPYRLAMAHHRLGAIASSRRWFTESLDRINPHLLEERLTRLAELL